MSHSNRDSLVTSAIAMQTLGLFPVDHMSLGCGFRRLRPEKHVPGNDMRTDAVRVTGLFLQGSKPGAGYLDDFIAAHLG